jgi:hypothetical protein
MHEVGIAGRMMTNREVGVFEEYWYREFCGRLGEDYSELGSVERREIFQMVQIKTKKKVQPTIRRLGTC